MSRNTSIRISLEQAASVPETAREMACCSSSLHIFGASLPRDTSLACLRSIGGAAGAAIFPDMRFTGYQVSTPPNERNVIVMRKQADICDPPRATLSTLCEIRSEIKHTGRR